jgi:4-amino-4-deoxy-L-arabinose transferase-like glycosyltransferase
MTTTAIDNQIPQEGRRRLSPELILCLALLTAARLIAAAAIPLTEDEAYYRLWAMRPAFGYFDHPPMVAWWVAAGRLIGGDTPFGTRVVAALATTIVSVLIVDIGRSIGFTRKTAERAAIWYNATFLIGLGGGIVTPDAPATFFWTLTLWAVARAERSGVGVWWLAAGAAAGLATLSKYSALFIGPGLLLWLLWSPKGRAELRRPWPWLALLAAAAVFSPNVVWNAEHGWLSFTKQFSRVAPSRFTPLHVLDFPATQFVLLNPLIAIFAGVGLMDFDWRGRQGWALLLLPLCITPFLAYLFLHSLHAGVQAHWPAPLYPAIALWAAWAADHRAIGVRLGMAKAVPWLGFVISAIIMLHLALPQTDYWIGKREPALPLRGWSTLANDVEALRVRQGAGWVGTLSYGTAVELLDQRKTTAPVIELIERGRYTFLDAPPQPQGPGVVVELGRRIGDADLTTCFRDVLRLADLERGDPGKPGVHYRAYRVDRPVVDLIAQGCRVGKNKGK